MRPRRDGEQTSTAAACGDGWAGQLPPDLGSHASVWTAPSSRLENRRAAPAGGGDKAQPKPLTMATSRVISPRKTLGQTWSDLVSLRLLPSHKRHPGRTSLTLVQQPQHTSERHRSLFTVRRHADHGRQLRQNQRAVPQPSGPRPPLPRSGAGVQTLVGIRADAVCTSARLGARGAHSRRRAGVVDALLGDTLRWRRVLLHWHSGRPGSGDVLPAVPAEPIAPQHWGHAICE